jgi:CheY-like chemotaxis protein
MAKLLIIDDEPEASAALAALLRHEGHEAVSVQSAGAALDQLRRGRPDLILLDLTMPRVDGLELLDALAAEPDYALIPVAVFSGRDDPESMESARSRGAFDYILKGADWAQTYAQIHACLACLACLPRRVDPFDPPANPPANLPA